MLKNQISKYYHFIYYYSSIIDFLIEIQKKYIRLFLIFDSVCKSNIVDFNNMQLFIQAILIVSFFFELKLSFRML